MKNFRKIITSPVTTVILFVLAAGLLLFSTIGGARAAFLAISETYAGHIEMYDIGVSLLEKCGGDEAPREVGYRNHIKDSEDKWEEGSIPLLDETNKDRAYGSFLGDDAEFIIGKAYTEELSVANTGNIEEYVRVTVNKYWTDPSGNKVLSIKDAAGNEIPESQKKGIATQGLSPALIRLELANEDVWLLDEAASTEERLIVYYNKVLAPDDPGTSAFDPEQTPPLSSTLTVDKLVGDKVTQIYLDAEGNTVSTKKEAKTIVTTYDYDGWKFCLEATVDAVQNHNAKEAIKSVWGRDVTVDKDGVLTLD